MPNVKIGSGSLCAVEPSTSKRPQYKGSIVVNGQKFWLSGWKRTGDDGSLRVFDLADESARPLAKAAFVRDHDVNF